ncbi:hypothetical protein D9Q98_003090 [Chlorella vulgaris]|uniref:Uncharacterized protein n=1 Tax=Chlorella vulgaris TaxID=3077 RepID=A0A9D4YZW4_CHLVU|nr:hypothetical protein D9Q98_003090 [Chlorella vulgaris]
MASRGVKERAGRWNQEVAAASEELRRTRKAVVDVQASLAALEEEAAGGAESLKALARLHRLDEEAASLAQQVAGNLQAAVGLCQSEAAQGAAARQWAVIGVEAASQRESELRGEFEAARQRLDAALEGQQAAISGSIEQLALQQAVEVAAEELGLLTEQQQRRRALEEAAAATAADARQQSAARGRLAADLAACQQAQHAVAADLEQASSAAAVAALLASLTAEEPSGGHSGTAVGCGSRGGGSQRWRLPPSFQCFGVSDLEGCQQYAEALQVLAGRKLGGVVADSTEAAAALMAAGGGTRIWPLDGLAAPDGTQQQCRAAQHFPDGETGGGLLRFEEAHRPALLRAFGAHVIAASDAARSVRPSGRITCHSNRQPQRLVVPGGRTLLAVPPAATPDVCDSAEEETETAYGCQYHEARDFSHLRPRVKERRASRSASLGTFEEGNTPAQQAYLKQLKETSKNLDKVIKAMRQMMFLRAVALVALSISASISLMVLGAVYVLEHFP